MMNSENSMVIPIKMGGVSAFILKGKSPILVDTGYPGSEDMIIKKADENGIDPADIKMILLTHGHDDHFGSVRRLKEKTGAKVAIHKLDIDKLRNGSNGNLIAIGTRGKIFSKLLSMMKKGKPEGMEPDIVFEDDLDLVPFGVNGRIIHTPGHTPGSISILLENGEMIIGDLMMALFSKKPGYPLFADDIAQVNSSIKKVMEYSPKIMYASHGGPFRPESTVKKFNLNP